MLKYAWAYQGHSNTVGEYIAYPIQTIDMRLDRSMPVIRLTQSENRVRVRHSLPATRAQNGQLYIFTAR